MNDGMLSKGQLDAAKRMFRFSALGNTMNEYHREGAHVDEVYVMEVPFERFRDLIISDPSFISEFPILSHSGQRYSGVVEANPRLVAALHHGRLEIRGKEIDSGKLTRDASARERWDNFSRRGALPALQRL